MDFSRLREINEQKAQLVAQELKDTRAELANAELQETIVQVAKSVVEFMKGNVSRTVVLNQLEDFTTREDAAELVQSINSLHDTLKTHENTDITPLTEVMGAALEQLKQIPKDHAKQAEQKFVDYTKQLNSLTEAVKAVNKAIEAQETTVEAPVVNVEAPKVTVDAPDLKPLTKEVNEAFAKAVQSIVFPKTDTSVIEEEQKKQTKLLKEIRDTPGGGSSGGGSIAPFLVDGALPITGSITASSSTLADFAINDSDNTTTADTEYFGFTKPDGTWLVKKSTATTMRYATVTNNGSVTTYADAWAAIATLTEDFEEAF